MRVLFLGVQLDLITFIDPSDVPSAYACMDVFVAPYVRPATETFALANIEAMAMRVPFVHFGTGGIQVRGRYWRWANLCRAEWMVVLDTIRFSVVQLQ